MELLRPLLPVALPEDLDTALRLDDDERPLELILPDTRELPELRDPDLLFEVAMVFIPLVMCTLT